MPRIARVGVDVAGAEIIGIMAPSVFVNGVPVACLGALVRGHGGQPHATPIMAQASLSVFAENIPICRMGDNASCGHQTTGSINAFAG